MALDGAGVFILLSSLGLQNHPANWSRALAFGLSAPEVDQKALGRDCPGDGFGATHPAPLSSTLTPCHHPGPGTVGRGLWQLLWARWPHFSGMQLAALEQCPGFNGCPLSPVIYFLFHWNNSWALASGGGALSCPLAFSSSRGAVGKQGMPPWCLGRGGAAAGRRPYRSWNVFRCGIWWYSE